MAERATDGRLFAGRLVVEEALGSKPIKFNGLVELFRGKFSSC